MPKIQTEEQILRIKEILMLRVDGVSPHKVNLSLNGWSGETQKKEEKFIYFVMLPINHPEDDSSFPQVVNSIDDLRSYYVRDDLIAVVNTYIEHLRHKKKEKVAVKKKEAELTVYARALRLYLEENHIHKFEHDRRIDAYLLKVLGPITEETLSRVRASFRGSFLSRNLTEEMFQIAVHVFSTEKKVLSL